MGNGILPFNLFNAFDGIFADNDLPDNSSNTGATSVAIDCADSFTCVIPPSMSDEICADAEDIFADICAWICYDWRCWSHDDNS